MKIRKNDQVVILAGKDKGKRGKVIEVQPKMDRVVVEGLNEVKKHMKPNNQNRQGGIITKSMPLDASNVMVIDPKTNEPTRVGRQASKSKKSVEKYVRVAKRSGTVLEG